MQSKKSIYSRFNQPNLTPVFSSSQFAYSKGTQDFMKVLMEESKLTNVQKNSFEGILRSGKPLPSNPGEIMFRKYQLYRRRSDAANEMGIRINRSGGNRKSSFAYKSPGKRSFNTILASGVFDTVDNRYSTSNYKPVNMEKEKDRLAHKMAFGTEPPSPRSICTEGKQLLYKEPPKIKKFAEELRQERLEEILEEIKDRALFLNDMRRLHQDRPHRPVILAQIKDKTREIEKLYPNEAEEIIHSLNLKEIDSEYPF